MIFGELFNVSRSQSVHPTVAYMTDSGQAILIVKEEGRYFRAHPPHGVFFLAGFNHFAIRLLHRDAQPAPSHGAPSVRIRYGGRASSCVSWTESRIASTAKVLANVPPTCPPMPSATT